MESPACTSLTPDPMVMGALGISNSCAEPRSPAAGTEDERPRFAKLARVAASLWFVLLGVIFAHGLLDMIHAVRVSGGGAVAWAAILSRSCSLMFFGTLGWLMLVRPRPVARRDEVLPTIIAFAGTYAVWLMPFLPHGAASPALQMLSAAVALAGSLSIIFAVLYLGRSFSIVPQARRLVIGGPYRFVRHPLYAAEELAIIGVLFQYAWYASLIFLVVHMALQIRRMNYEESLLLSVFPDYEAYARRTARLIPGVW